MVRPRILFPFPEAGLNLRDAFNLALAHLDAGRVAEADELYRRLIAHEPTHAEPLFLLSVLAWRCGRAAEAENLIDRAIALRPESAKFHLQRGIVLASTGRFQAAMEACQRALTLQPDFPEAHNVLGTTLQRLGRLEPAITEYRRALALRPDWIDALSNLGHALTETGSSAEAVEILERAVQLRPDFADGWNHLGTALHAQHQTDGAIEAFQKAASLRPNFPEAWNNLGNSLREIGRPEQAIEAYQKAIAIAPGYAEALVNLGNVLKDAGLLTEAIARYRQAAAVSPDSWAASNLLFALHYDPDCTPEQLLAEHVRWGDRCASRAAPAVRPHDNDPDPARRLRVGYVSPDFRDHVVGHNLLPLFERHDHERFEVFCYANVARPDALTDRFRSRADVWRDIHGVNDADTVQRIREDRIDILIDLALHTAGNRLPLFALRPAPVQITFAGYPSTTGLPTIDYRLTDRLLDPPGETESLYREKFLYLPDSFWCFQPQPDEPPVNDPPESGNGFVTFGCLNNFGKINPAVLALWARVLTAEPTSKLLLLAGPGGHRDRTLDRLAAHGVERSRVAFAEPQLRGRYLQTYHRMDIGLDTFPYNGHTTSLDSLRMGVPVVTLVGRSAVARAGWCQLSNLGLPELAAHSPDDFVRIALELARDRHRLSELRRGLRKRMEDSPLMNATRFARGVEAALRRAWVEWCRARAA